MGKRCKACADRVATAALADLVFSATELMEFDFDAVPAGMCEACAFRAWVKARRAA